MNLNINNKNNWSEWLLMLLFSLLIIEATAIWKCNKGPGDNSKGSGDDTEVSTVSGCKKPGNGKALPTFCKSKQHRLIEIQFNSNNTTLTSLQLTQLEYGISEVDSDASHSLADVDLQAYKCHLNATIKFLLENDSLQFNEMKVESRAVSIRPNAVAVFYQLTRDCFWPISDHRGGAHLKLHFEPTKLQLPLEPNCSPRDLLLPIKPDRDEIYTQVGVAGQAKTSIRISFIEGVSLHNLPSNLEISFEELDKYNARDYNNKYVDAMTTIGHSAITGFNWTAFIPDNRIHGRRFAFGRLFDSFLMELEHGNLGQSFQVVGECEPFRFYTNIKYTRFLDKFNRKCVSGTFPTLDGCPGLGNMVPETFPVADPPYWQ